MHFYKNDQLGHLCNILAALHAKLGREGPHDERLQDLAGLISQQVDFAKHGRSLNEQDMEKVEKLFKDICQGEFPDFLARSFDNQFEAKTING